MVLTSGARLGPYEVIAPIGAGGMGDVYRARDLRLDRIVAIKVLPGLLSPDPDLKLRLEREARALSSLNHANICTLHDLGSEGRSRFSCHGVSGGRDSGPSSAERSAAF